MCDDVTPTFSESPAGRHTHRPGRYVRIGQTHRRHLSVVLETILQPDQGDVVASHLSANYVTRMCEEPFNFEDHLSPVGFVAVVFANDNSQLRRLLAFSVKQHQVGLRFKVTERISICCIISTIMIHYLVKVPVTYTTENRQ